MRRILLVLSTGLVMVALVMATAMPVFADRGIQGHVSQTGECENIRNCDVTVTFAGKGGAEDPGGGRRRTADITTDLNDPNPLNQRSFTTQGGGPAQGGGNCFFTVDEFNPDPDEQFNEGGKGKRCPEEV